MTSRVSGTVTLGPQSGPIVPGTSTSGSSSTGGGPVSSITQQGGATIISGTSTVFSSGTYITITSKQNVGSVTNPTGLPYIGGELNAITIDGYPGSPILYSTPEERALAGTYFAGGVGVEQDLSVGGLIYGRVAFANSSTTSTNVVVRSTVSGNFALVIAPLNRLDSIIGTPLYANTSNVAPLSDTTMSPGGLLFNPALGLLTVENVQVDGRTPSTSTVTGAFTVTGGVGITGDVYIGGHGSTATNYGGVMPASQNTGTIGTQDFEWASAYMNKIYSQFVGSTSSNITLSPKNGVNLPTGYNGDNVLGGGTVDIFGDIRVRGNNPIGTAPVVTNVLYVTMDGDDTNDGRAMDPSRACRTISGAVKSPAYQSGTQIRVMPGHYLENNPIQLKPYTSIMGSDIRTTGVEPINKTQDLFHMNSGCYLAFMQFLNGRSGLLPGNAYINGTNRGAYCTAFPPLPTGQQITLFHSPYIQNCTNLSGPWLYDGTMFVPDETVQIPIAIGTGTWAANTTTIVVDIANLPINGFINAGIPGSSSTQYTGELSGTLTAQGSIATANLLNAISNPALLDAYIATDTGNIWVYTAARSLSLGMSISDGQQTQGFFNARTLILANKPFLQAQVVGYITHQVNANLLNPGSIWYNFVYNQQLCYRDVGIILENIAYDAAFGGNEKSIEAGKAYWNGVVSYIATEIPQTIAALNYLDTLVQNVIVNTTCSVFPKVVGIPAANQVRNTVMLDGGVASPSITSLFNIITDIINNGPSVAPALYNSSGPDAAYHSAEILLQANRKFIQEQTINYINWNLVQPTSPNYLPYNKVKCERDTGIIIDSIATDLLFPTTQNSQITFAGLQYYKQNGYTGNISTEITTTTKAVAYLQTIANKVLLNVTPSQDAIVGVTRFSNGTQLTNIAPATQLEIAKVNNEFGIILNILGGNTTGWTDLIEPNGGTVNPLKSVQDAYDLLQANLTYIQNEVYAYVTTGTVYGGLGFTNFTAATCIRDIGYIVNSVCFDLLYGGNRQAIQSGLSYYTQVGGTTLIPMETTATSRAFTFLGSAINTLITQPSDYIPYQTKIEPNTSLPLADNTVASAVTTLVSTLTSIITTTTGIAGYEFTPISLAQNTSADFVNAYNIIKANRSFLVAETLAWIDKTYNSTSTFVFDEATYSRDTGLIVDAIGMDMLYESTSDSIFAGLQYWGQSDYTGNINSEVTAVIAATNFLSTVAQSYVTSKSTVASLMSTITNIILNGVTGITDQIIPEGLASVNSTIVADYNALQANRTSMQNSVMNYLYINYPSLSYTTSTCFRDVGYIIDAVSFDLLHSGNLQSIKSGVYYWDYNNITQIPKEVPEIISAYNFIGTIVGNIVTANTITNTYQTATIQITNLSPATITEANALRSKISTITNIIVHGPSVAGPKSPQRLALTYDSQAQNAWNLLHANRAFIQAEVLSYLKTSSSVTPFSYNQDVCYRDVGLMVDAVSQDIILGGNQRSIEAGLSYWNQGYNYVANELTTITQAISYISAISQQVVANSAVTSITGTVATQVINPFFEYGSNYMPQQSVARNFGIISTIINDGPASAPPVYAGGGLFALTGLNGADVQSSPTVVYIDMLTTGTYLIGLSTATVGFGNNSSLYFGNTGVFPLQNAQVDALSLQQTGSTSTWNSRKVDPIGSMGGSLVDGAVISPQSPIQSFVYDAFTQLTQGGRGVRVTNNGYAQLVSVFTIFGSVGVQVDNGGIASIVNSNANFGDLCLVAKGYGKRSFSGTVYNPPNRAYPFSPVSVYGNNALDPYYPTGFWPDKNGSIEVFLPDSANRPHISLVMEVIPTAAYVSQYNSPELAAKGIVLEGFLNAKPSTGTLVTGSIDLVGIDTTDVYIGNNVYVIDQFGYPYDHFPNVHDEFGNFLDINGSVTTTVSNYISNPAYNVWYCQTGTTVVDVNYNDITLNKALTSGAHFPANSNYFTIYFTGNAYYTVQTSQVANSPYQLNTNILSSNANALFQGPVVDQITQHAAAIRYLNILTNYVISNDNSQSVSYYQNTVPQTTVGSLAGGAAATPFVNLEFKYITSIITATNLNAALSVVPSNLITETGTIPSGAGSAVKLIEANLDFFGAEVFAFVQNQYPTLLNGSAGTDQQIKCKRDVELIMQQLIYDLETGGNYNAVYSGLSYWSRGGTYHIVELGEAVTDPNLFPDGATVNFYQRSYISASGYVFEYVGAGSNYGALPQVGLADPVQGHETVQLDSGKVFFTSTDQNGDFRIGPGLVISQATGVISGRTFTQSLFANMTPFILAIEAL